MGKLKKVSLDDAIDQHIGKVGTPRRDAFEAKLKKDLEIEEINKAFKDFTGMDI